MAGRWRVFARSCGVCSARTGAALPMLSHQLTYFLCYALMQDLLLDKALPRPGQPDHCLWQQHCGYQSTHSPRLRRVFQEHTVAGLSAVTPIAPGDAAPVARVTDAAMSMPS